MDFLDSLKDIKKELQHQAKQAQKKKEEFDPEKENIEARFSRLQDEFGEYIKNENIKRI